MSSRAEGIIYRVFAESASQNGDNVAVEGTSPISYGDLDREVRALARQVMDVAPPASRVAVHGAGGVDDLIAVLAVSAAGCSVVPVGDTGSTGEAARLRRLRVAAVVETEAEGHRARELRTTPAAHTAETYVLATSGSTSAPKDVPIDETNLRALLKNLPAPASVRPDDRVAVNYRITFDPYFLVVLATFSAGATLVLPRAKENLAVTSFVTSREISYWRSVPSHIALALRTRTLKPGTMPGLRVSIFGGEALDADLVRAWRQAAPRSIIGNSYGPTETTITAFQAFIHPGEPVPDSSTVPLGAPIAGLEVRVEPLEVGSAEGELLLRGPQRFAGYADPDENRGRFTPRPADDQTQVPPSVWYQTGDIVSVVGSELYFVRRRDDEVKVQGHRVDLAEVRREVRRATGAAEVWVGIVDRRLNAVVSSSRPTPDLSALRPYARPRLTVWASLPKLPNGKFDGVAIRARLAGS